MPTYTAKSAARSAAAQQAANARCITRSFFFAAGAVALVMVYFVFAQETRGDGAKVQAVGLIGFESGGGIRGGGVNLPARDGHSHEHGSAHSGGTEHGQGASPGASSGIGSDAGAGSHGGHEHAHNHDIDAEPPVGEEEEEVEDKDGALSRASAGSAQAWAEAARGNSAAEALARRIEGAVSKVERRITRDVSTGKTVIEETVYYKAGSEEDALALADALTQDGTDVTVRRPGAATPAQKEQVHEKEPATEGKKKEKEQEQPVKQPGKGGSGSSTAWSEPPIPGWDPSWVGKQRPVAGEADVTSHTFEEAGQHSMNPPVNARDLRAALGGDDAVSGDAVAYASLSVPGATGIAKSSWTAGEIAEVEHRVVVAIALGVHSGEKGKAISAGDKNALSALPIVKVLLGTLLPVAQPHFLYRFYFAYDHNDPVYEKEANRQAVHELYAAAFAAEDAKRWHAPQAQAGGPIDGTRLLHSIHWVHCDYNGKPSWAHSDAVVAAYKEGADYAYRTNDDSAFPTNPDWADKFIQNLRSRTPVPNVGVVGPTCHEGANWILTHDFTHKTHVTIYGWQYPRGLPDWSSDDWVTFVYSGFGLTAKLPDVTTSHTMSDGTRYNPTAQAIRLQVLNNELQQGSKVLDAWLKAKGHTVPYTVEVRTCC